MTGTVGVPILPAMGLPGAGLPSRVRRRILPRGWLGSCAGVMRWRSPDGEEEGLAVGGEGYGGAELAAVAAFAVAPDDVEVFEAGGIRAERELGAGEGEAGAAFAGLGVGEIDVVVLCVVWRDINAEHAALALPQNGWDVGDGGLGTLPG